jgi:hypothetical protein
VTLDYHHEINRRRTAVKRIIVMALGVLLTLALATPMALAQVEPGAAESARATQLDAAWWSWAVSTPASKNPLNGGDPDYSDAQCNGQPVTKTATNEWFLAGSAGALLDDGGHVISGSGAERTCDVPAGTHLVFPILSNICATPVDADPNDPDAPENLSECARRVTDDMLEDGEYYVKVDGQDVAANRIVRAQPSPYTINFYDDPNSNDDNIFAGYGYLGEQTAASAGLYGRLPPLSKGEHTIEWAGKFPWTGGEVYDEGPIYPEFELVQETTYNITVK